MKSIPLAAAALIFATAVNAQIFQWKDENGKTIISDKPPSGNVSQQRKIASDSPAATQKTSADRELEFRKRLKSSQESAEKAEKEQAASAEKTENCDKARRHLQVLESGERVALRDDKGERYFMDDTQRQQEIEKSRQFVQANCN